MNQQQCGCLNVTARKSNVISSSCVLDGVRKSIVFRSDFPANEFTQESATEKYVPYIEGMTTI